MLSIEEKPLDRAAFFVVQKGTGFCRGVWRYTHSRRILCNLGKREQFARIMSNVERYKNLYFCDCA